VAQDGALGGFAVVTGASTGIGFELAKLAAEDGYNLLIVADEKDIEGAALRSAQHQQCSDATKSRGLMVASCRAALGRLGEAMHRTPRGACSKAERPQSTEREPSGRC
jgi:NAD(P)-dependent dehydrogenase (short-subunit alcohol dehydrogenase family)